MKKIMLTQGKDALVDNVDFKRLSIYIWCAVRKGKNWYAQRQVRDLTKRRRQSTLYMHHEILRAPRGMMVDHLDRNGLNNCRNNLVICSRGDNIANSVGSQNRKSKYKGVYPNHGKWHVSIRFHNELLYIGNFETEEEAAKAYDEKIIELRGNRAVLNFQ